MSDKTSKYELDDELLSAYLDGELAAEDRAAVEARLASDPAAQQLLHELRSVSQDVQALPQEKLGRDMSESIVRRALEANPRTVAVDTKPVAAKQPSPASREPLPKIKIFGSSRAWIWASLALAAGLLIMFVQKGDDSADKLPPVARRDQPIATSQPAAEIAENSPHDLKIAPAPETPPPATVALGGDRKDESRSMPAAKPSAPLVASGEKAKAGNDASFGAVAAPKQQKGTVDFQADTAAGLAATPGGHAITEKLGTPLLPPEPTGGARGAGSASTASGKLEATVDEKPRLVVHVVAKQRALENKSFDQLLDRHQIVFESPPQAEEGEKVRNNLSPLPQQQANSRYTKRPADKLAEHENIDNVELVFVEASPATIVACLADLHQDTGDYSIIDVKERSQPQDRTSAGAAPAKKSYDDLGKFNRGRALEDQKDYFGKMKEEYDYLSQKPKEYGVGAAANGGPATAPAASAPNATATTTIAGSTVHAAKAVDQPDLRPQTEDLGRARRVPIADRYYRKLDELRTAGRGIQTESKTEPARSPMSKQALDERAKSAAESEKWQVLFVLSPEQSATTSAPPTDRTK